MSATIVELRVENVKRLKAIQIEPKGSTVVISGRNGQGKSSALDSIDYAFRGEKEICDEPLRKGEKRGSVFIKLSEELSGVCTIERRFTPGGTVLEIRNAEGVPQKSPQALLDTITSKMAFDPLSWMRKKKDEQFEMLRKLVGLDFTEVNAARRLAFEERTIRNRELESAKAKLGAHVFNPALPKDPVSIQDLALKLGEVRAKNSSIHQRKQAVAAQKQKEFDLAEDVRSLQSKLKQLQEMVKATETQIDAKVKAHAEAAIESQRMAAEITTLQATDETGLQKQIDEIQQTNAAIEQNRLHHAAQENVDLLEGAVKGLSAKIVECDEMKAAQIEFANFPMEGLSFDEERGVLLNGVPFSQGSQAEQLCAAVAIGLALNPQVKVILIRDGSLLDADSLKAVSEVIEKNNAQLWVEVVNSDSPTAIVIEDGEVK